MREPKDRAARILLRKWVPREHRKEADFKLILDTLPCAQLALTLAWKDFIKALKKDLTFPRIRAIMGGRINRPKEHGNETD